MQMFSLPNENISWTDSHHCSVHFLQSFKTYIWSTLVCRSTCAICDTMLGSAVASTRLASSATLGLNSRLFFLPVGSFGVGNGSSVSRLVRLESPASVTMGTFTEGCTSPFILAIYMVECGRIRMWSVTGMV